MMKVKILQGTVVHGVYVSPATISENNSVTPTVIDVDEQTAKTIVEVCKSGVYAEENN